MFGCTNYENGLFTSQYANGILGLDDESEFLKSIENYNDIPNNINFSICLSDTGGLFRFNRQNKEHHLESKPITINYYNDSL